MTQAKTLLETSALARQSGLPASTLRYYEERGLIHSVGRHGLQRLFPASTADRLQLISAGRAAGFSLDDLQQMFGPGDAPKIDRQTLRDQAQVLDQQIRRLTALRDGLTHAASCREKDPMQCGKFQRLLKLASDRFSAR